MDKFHFLNESDESCAETPCDFCRKPLGADREPHFPHPEECALGFGEECDCTVRLEVHDSCCIECHPELVPSETLYSKRRQRFYPDRADLLAIPELYATEGAPLDERAVHLHYVSPGGEWWVIERDRSTNVAFGYACLNDAQMAEWGYVDLAELESTMFTSVLQTPSGLEWPVETCVKRDLSWQPDFVRNCRLPGYS